MIISGGARTNWRFFAGHLTNARDNEHITLAEMRGLSAQSVRGALREMDAIAMGTHCKNSFYHADINTRSDEHLTEEQWQIAVDTLEHNLRLDGHARFVMEHTKEGRTHRHVVWSRIDPDTMKAVSDSHNFRVHEKTSRELETLFGHDPVASSLDRDAGTERPDRRPANWEVFRGKRSKIDPADVKREVTALWNSADSGTAFAAALEAGGYVLCRGDSRAFVILDAAGDTHSLVRRIDGVKSAAVRARMAGIDLEALPSPEEGRALLVHLREAPETPDKQDTLAPGISAADADAAHKAIEDYVDTAIGAGADDKPAPVWSIEEIEAAIAAQRRQAGATTQHIDDYATPIDEALRRGEPVPTRDGLTWFARMHTVLSTKVEAVVDWARERFDSFVERVNELRGGWGKSPGDDEPDMER